MINSFVYKCSPIDDGAIIMAQGPCRIVNAALISKPPVGYSGTFRYGQPASTNSLEIVNSIFLDLEHSYYVDNFLLTCVNCLFYDVRDYLFTGGVNPIANVAGLNLQPGSYGNIAMDPLLVSRTNHNFALRSGSPCIDAGTSAGVLLATFDYFGQPRVNGLQPDIGPIEFSVPSPVLIPSFFGNGVLAIQWAGISGVLYDVYSANSLNGPWTVVSGMTRLLGTGRNLSVTNNITSERTRFFRVAAR